MTAPNKHRTRRHEEDIGGSRAQHVETINYSASAGICVGEGKAIGSSADSGFWLVVLETFPGKNLKREEEDRAERRIHEVIGWIDPIEEKIGFLDAACQNYDILIDDMRAGKFGGACPLGRYDTRSGP